MKACFPVTQDRGLESRVHPNFGSAPMFLIVDTETKATRAIASPVLGGTPELCRSFTALANEKIDLVIVSSIGAGALDRLRTARVPAYHTAHATAGAALQAIGGGALPPVLAEASCGSKPGASGHACAGHGDGHERGEGHGARGCVGCAPRS